MLPISIGIAGGSGSGKTTISNYLAHALTNYKIKVIHMDKYYKKKRPIAIAPFSGKEYEDFNHPTAIDIDQVINQFNQALHSKEYDLVLIEGFLLFHFPELHELIDYKVFVDCQSDDRLVRRIDKFSVERYTQEEVITEYLDLVRHRHDEFVEPTRWHANLIINGSQRTEKGSQMLLDWLRQKLKEGYHDNNH
ncbi:uridine kinase [Paenibacillus sp. yr247]|uniref:AAA family ATPase n=1 Tax=Paenibacillus sp. yr247 TaxID=1761880 RepID=UPI000881A46C|nr:AAA family ATPase [Paenibacillus sp. yr247]SDO02741.1 uridine kinase [Paenibacillus sp. yr247]